MSETNNTGISFPCNGTMEATLIRNAVNLYRHVLKQNGQDPRNYAPATAEGAGFGWDAVQRATGDMGKGTVTHMSRRMAEAIRAALLAKAERTPDRDAHLMATRLANRMAAILAAGHKSTD